ncbi:MAG: hypothetical protein US42_C0001G0050 [Candidatus Magasanikbacteria bacterium GW2011_GWC2_37_14]|uniref:Lipoprotein n=1 Tax=Candidatus Magasanikbacteria bacterium GW2011_GWC2_37_14 TaxID=1619046 RepID=A0A0G0IVN5_9BACT|nr:MAG: hypothetical protein US42_C0001G0050 [Candidatus Magasanikbacteria bacterium GW2011_GWC2_37_14]
MKILNNYKILLTSVMAVLLVGGGCSEVPKDQEINYENDVLPLLETKTESKVRGSCNMIESKSTCFDFIGEIFTEDRMRLSCEEGKFSLDGCPYSDLGGCQATPGTVSESIAWSYNYGGQPISAEEAGYQAQACNAMTISKWVLPADLLKK